VQKGTNMHWLNVVLLVGLAYMLGWHAHQWVHAAERAAEWWR